MKQFKKVLESKKTTIVLSIIIIVLLPFCWKTIVYNFECLAGYLYGTGVDNKGKLLTVILTTIGGLGALWGLWLNNQRLNQQIRQVNEQVRQNNIAIQNSNDKRFGEAIGYLNDDNEGIAIGGVYALYQLAKEDERYAPIITNIFCNYVNDNTDKQDKKSYKTILSLLFSKDNPFVFGKIRTFRNLKFDDTILYCNHLKIEFIKCSFFSSIILDGDKIDLIECSIKDSYILDFSSVLISRSNCDKIKIISNKYSYIHFTDNILNSIEIIVSKIQTLLLLYGSVSKMNVYSDYIEEIFIEDSKEETFVSELIIHYVSSIKNIFVNGNSNIDRSQFNIIRESAMKSDKTYRQIVGSYNQRL